MYNRSKRKTILVIAIMSAITGSVSAQYVNQRDIPIEKRSGMVDTTVKAGAEFIKSWETGVTVRGKADYEMDGTFRISRDRNVSFWQKIKKWDWGRKTFNAHFEGDAKFETSCILADRDNSLGGLRLWRTYSDVKAFRVSSMNAKYFPDSEGVRRFLKTVYEGELIEYTNVWAEKGRRLAQAMKKAGGRIAAEGAVKSLTNPYVGGVIAAVGAATSAIGEGTENVADAAKSPKGQEVIGWANKVLNDKIKAQGINMEDGGFEITPESKAWSKFSMLNEATNSVGNIAVSIATDFDCKSFYIRTVNGGRNRIWDVSERSDMDELTTIVDLKKRNIDEMIAGYKTFEDRHNEISDNWVRGCVERESFALGTIYGDYSRRKGEEWKINGRSLDSFLHPDLKGTFKGQVWLRYEDDESREIAWANETKNYHVRKIVLLPQSSEGDVSSLKYSEGDGRFEVSYSAASEARMWIDKVSGQVIEIQINFKGDVKTLPNMKLTEGLEGAGEVKLRIRYMAQVGMAQENVD